MSDVVQKFYCLCLTESGEEVYLAIRATSGSHATKLIHRPHDKGGYAVEYVLDIFTPLQMEYKKRHLRKSNLLPSSLP